MQVYYGGKATRGKDFHNLIGIDQSKWLGFSTFRKERRSELCSHLWVNITIYGI